MTTSSSISTPTNELECELALEVVVPSYTLSLAVIPETVRALRVIVAVVVG